MDRNNKNKKRGATLADVAQASGVSKTTASLILNDKSSEARVTRVARIVPADTGPLPLDDQTLY